MILPTRRSEHNDGLGFQKIQLIHGDQWGLIIIITLYLARPSAEKKDNQLLTCSLSFSSLIGQSYSIRPLISLYLGAQHLKSCFSVYEIT